MDVVVNFAPELAKGLAPADGADRQQMVGALDAALTRLQSDATLSRADRMSALIGRVDLARLDQPKDTATPKIPAPLIKQVKDEAARADREVTDGYERQAVITAAAYMLGQAGQWKDSDALLKSSLAKSHSPYYLMNQLAGNAKKQGRKAEDLNPTGANADANASRVLRRMGSAPQYAERHVVRSSLCRSSGPTFPTIA